VTQLLIATTIVVSGVAMIWCLVAGLQVLLGNRLEYERNRRRSGDLIRALKGDVPTVSDGTRDFRVAAGIAVRDGKWVEQGRLSTEAVSAALRRTQ
jgi:hypothetical protein